MEKVYNVYLFNKYASDTHEWKHWKASYIYRALHYMKSS